MLTDCGKCSIFVIKMQIYTSLEMGQPIFCESDGGGYNWRHLRTGREDSIPSTTLPANDLPHFLQSDVFQQHEHWSNLIGEPGLHKRERSHD